MEKKTAVIRLEKAVSELSSAIQDVIGMDAKIRIYASAYDSQASYHKAFEGKERSAIIYGLNVLGLPFYEKEGHISDEERICFDMEELNFSFQAHLKKGEEAKKAALLKRKEEIEAQLEKMREAEEIMREDQRENYVTGFGGGQNL